MFAVFKEHKKLGIFFLDFRVFSNMMFVHVEVKILVAYPPGDCPLSFKGAHGCVSPSLILVLALSVSRMLVRSKKQAMAKSNPATKEKLMMACYPTYFSRWW